MDDITYGFLNNFSDGRQLSLYDLSVLLDVDPVQLVQVVKILSENQYIEAAYPIPDSDLYDLDTPYKITYTGRSALILHEHQKHHSFLVEFRAWCTLAIAIAAFIKSFFF